MAMSDGNWDIVLIDTAINGNNGTGGQGYFGPAGGGNAPAIPPPQLEADSWYEVWFQLLNKRTSGTNSHIIAFDFLMNTANFAEYDLISIHLDYIRALSATDIWNPTTAILSPFSRYVFLSNMTRAMATFGESSDNNASGNFEWHGVVGRGIVKTKAGSPGWSFMPRFAYSNAPGGTPVNQAGSFIAARPLFGGISTPFFGRQETDNILPNSSDAQNLFSGITLPTLDADTDYSFELAFSFQCSAVAAFTDTLNYLWDLGSSVLTSYMATQSSTVLATGSALPDYVTDPTANISLGTSGGSTALQAGQLVLKGSFRLSTGGIWTPKLKHTVTPDVTTSVKAGSYLKIWQANG